MDKASVQKMLKINLYKMVCFHKVFKEECVDFCQIKSVNTLFLVISIFLKLINLFKNQDLRLVIGKEVMDFKIIMFSCDISRICDYLCKSSLRRYIIFYKIFFS